MISVIYVQFFTTKSTDCMKKLSKIFYCKLSSNGKSKLITTRCRNIYIYIICRRNPFCLLYPFDNFRKNMKDHWLLMSKIKKGLKTKKIRFIRTNVSLYIYILLVAFVIVCFFLYFLHYFLLYSTYFHVNSISAVNTFTIENSLPNLLLLLCL